jgi:hypothetical protein
MQHLSLEQKGWFISYFNHLAKIGLTPNPESPMSKTELTKSETQPMPDLLPVVEVERSELHAECRLHLLDHWYSHQWPLCGLCHFLDDDPGECDVEHLQSLIQRTTK